MHRLSISARMAISLIVAIIMIAPAAIAAQTPSDNFTIKSYIPEKFVDFQSNLTSDLSISGHDSKYDQGDFDQFDTTTIENNQRGSSNNQHFYFSNLSAYRNETVLRYLDASLAASSHLYGSYSWTSDNRSFTSGYSSHTYRRDQTNSIQLYLFPVIDAGRYLIDDFFISTYSSFRFSYNNSWKNINIDNVQSTNSPSPGYFESSIDNSKDDGDIHYDYYDLDLSLLAGIGHVYEGRYASTALYIIDELRDKNLLVNEPSKTQMMQLSELIYQSKLEHYFDSRLHDIEVVDNIWQYLKSEGLIAQNSLKAPVIINDVWRSFPNYARQFGIRIRGGVGYDYYYSFEKRKTTNDYYRLLTSYYADSANVIDTLSESAGTRTDRTTSKSTSSLPYIVGMIEYFNPINHRWQINLNLSGNYYLNPDRITTHKYYYGSATDPSGSTNKTSLKETYEATLDGEARYIFNSRTNALFYATLGYWHLKSSLTNTDISGNTETSEIFNGQPHSSRYYSFGTYISYRITIPITLVLQASYSHNNSLASQLYSSSHIHNSAYNIGAGLTYLLF